MEKEDEEDEEVESGARSDTSVSSKCFFLMSKR